MNRLIKTFTVIFLIVLLSSCGTQLSPKASKQEQKEVKDKILKLLKDEYNQPFKIIDFNYSYDTHYPNGNCSDCRILKYGIYIFKVEAVNNSILSLKVKLYDNGQNMIEDFKKTYLDRFYCGALGSYFDDLRMKQIKNPNKADLSRAENLCNSRNQTIYYEKPKEEYLKSIQ